MNPVPYHGRFLYPGSSTPFPSSNPFPSSRPLRFEPSSFKLPTPTYSIPSPPLRFEPSSFKLPTPTYSIPSPPLRFEPSSFKLPTPTYSIPSPPLRFEPSRFKLPTPTYSIPPPPVFSYSAPDLKNFKIESPNLEYRPMHAAPYVPSPLEKKVMSLFLLTLVWGYTAVIVAVIARNIDFAKKYETPIAIIGATVVTALTYTNMPLGLASIAIITLIGCLVSKPSIQPPLPIHLPPPQPINFHPALQAEDVRSIMGLDAGLCNTPNNLRVEKR